ncbi:MAG: P-II family nitrogen regulator [Halanaerobium sp.]|nr:P-II family nitrogen regulator [Halanaerobium sp.]
MQLLVVVIDQENKLDDVFEAFQEIGVSGVTVFDSMGSGHLDSEDLSIFGRLAHLTGSRKKHNKTLLSVIKSPEVLHKAVEAVEKIVGDFNRPHTAFLFTIPLGTVKGLSLTKSNQ